MPRRALPPILSAFALFLASSVVFAQGSAGGYGAGGAGGGFGGGGFSGAARERDGGSHLSDPEQNRRPELREGELWSTRSAILTPGDRVDFKFNVKKGQLILAAVNTEAFDPALAVIDPAGNEVLKNDDRREGDQLPFIVYRATENGTYLVRVLSFRSAAGGKFDLRSRVVTPVDYTEGQLTHLEDNAIGNSQNSGYERNRFFVALPVKARKTYELSVRSKGKNGGSYPYEFVRAYVENGLEQELVHELPIPTTPNRREVAISSAIDGVIYAEYQAGSPSDLEIEWHAIEEVSIGQEARQKLAFKARELKIVKFKAEQNELGRFATRGLDLQTWISGPYMDQEDARYTFEEGPQEMVQRFDPYIKYRTGRKSDDEVIRVFQKGGEYLMILRSNINTTGEAELIKTATLPEWKPGQDLRETLGIGEARFLLLRSSQSQLLKLFAASKTFETRLDIFRLNGELANSLIDRQTHIATDDLYFPQADTFLIRLTSDGFGGGGPFEARYTPLEPKPYTMGSAISVGLNGSDFGLFSITLEAGKMYELKVESPPAATRIDILSDAGEFIGGQRLTFGNVTVIYFTPPASGRYRIWLRGEAGARKLQLTPFTPPTVTSK